MPKYTGNTLSEYAFVLALIGLLAVGGLRLLGPSISQLFNIDQSSSNPVGNYVATVLPSTSAPDNTSGQDTAIAPGATAPEGNNNQLLQLHASSTGGTNVTSVDGLSKVNGSSQTLKNLLQEIQADPNHDPNVLAMVTKLSNTGHSAAETMRGGVTIYQMAIEANGGEVLTMESVSILNTIQSGIDFKNQFQELATYVNAHPDALSGNQIQTIQLASNDITGILDQLGNPNGTKGNDLVNSDAWKAMAINHMEVQQDSNTICRNGGNTSQCVR